MLGNIVYLYLLDLTNNLAVRQELIENRFCKIIKEEHIESGSNEKYVEYKLQSLTEDHIYSTNNYLSPYQFCNLNELENEIDRLSDILAPDKKEKMLETINNIKENHLEIEKA